jgi:two-component system phosphate regulon sensor histidine kinase PhoR
LKKIIFKRIAVFAAAVVVITAAVCIGSMILFGAQDDFAGATLKTIPILVALAVIAVLTANGISKKLAAEIAKPINEMSIDNIGETEIFDEIKPILGRIKRRNLSKERAEQMRREFSANVSHELKTPLTSISGYAQMINNGMAKDEDLRMFTNRIEKESSRLLLLINDIIALSNLDEINGMTEAEDVDLAALAQETIVSLEKAAEDKGVQIFYSGKETHIKGNKTYLGELMFNIIDNAIKYNKENGTITVVVGTGAKGAVFSVKDTGIGIPEEDVDRIFERFYRVDKSHSKTVGGTGLGLSIVKHIAICHNAKINVKSKLGRGTTISVIFG